MPENVETVRRVYEVVNARHQLPREPFDPAWELQGTRDYFAWFDDSFDEFRSEVEEIIDAREDRVVVLYRFRARGKASGVPLDQRGGMVITFRGEQIVRMDNYFDQAEALDAAGLRE